MASNNNIFYATNPARMLDALWKVIESDQGALRDALIFVPSRRAVRSVERMIVQKMGRAVILPRLVALGEGDFLDGDFEDAPTKKLSRVIMMARLLAADANIGNLTTALPVARDLVRLQDYLENEGIDAAAIDWAQLVDQKYAAHFQGKAQILNILAQLTFDKQTEVQIQNQKIRSWIDKLQNYRRVIICGSTASVPATADLMRSVAMSRNGVIILSGKISGQADDMLLPTNPYNAESKFLMSLGINIGDVQPIDVGASAIDFFNDAFGNQASVSADVNSVQHCHLIEAARESEEANVVAEIAQRSVAQNKSVLVITPDAAGNQRIARAIAARGLMGDFSGGLSGAMTQAGRAVLNTFDAWIDSGDSSVFDKFYMDADFDLNDAIINMVDNNVILHSPKFDFADDASLAVWGAVRDLSDAVKDSGVQLTLADARAFLADAFGAVSVRSPMKDAADVVVLGTIESRMQTADVVILTGLNDGMFPARGYENAWLPTDVAEKIGLPSPDRKVSLQALDFMNLSCGREVYWTRSCISGGVQTMQSRFLSRVIARRGAINTDAAADILNAVRGVDNPVSRPLDYSAPQPPADWTPVYATEIETLIHNPYAFYVRHILRLRVEKDYWVGADALDFGNLVHEVIETSPTLDTESLIAQMDARAQGLLGADSIMFHFWHKRFCEIAPFVSEKLAGRARDKNINIEQQGRMTIAGREIRARADMIWPGVVMDIKTGAAPTEKSLAEATMPQLPIEALIMQSGGFESVGAAAAPQIDFLQLRNNDLKLVQYDADVTAQMMMAAKIKVTDLVNMYSAGGAAYEYYETGDAKYKAYDDLARRLD